MRLKEEKIVKKYFSAKEVVKMLAESPATLRYWVKAFNLEARHLINNTIYPRETVAKLHVIRTLLRVEKYTIEGAKQKLK